VYRRMLRSLCGVKKLGYSDLLYHKKKLVMSRSLGVACGSLGHQLALPCREQGPLASRPFEKRFGRQRSSQPPRHAYLSNVYVEIWKSLEDAKVIEQAIRIVGLGSNILSANRRHFDFIGDVFAGEEIGPTYFRIRREGTIEFRNRWQQFTGPIHGAKRFEDTFLYVHILLNLAE